MEKPSKSTLSIGDLAIAIATVLAIALMQTLWLAVQDLSEQVMEQGRVIESLLEAEHDRLEHELQQQSRQILAQPIPLAADPAHEPKFTPLDIPLSESIQQTVWDLCGEYPTFLSHQDFFELVLKVMWNESRHQMDVPDNYNTNGTVDRGPMQINSINWKWLSDEGLDINQQEDNIEAGVRILSDFLNRYQDAEYALTAYGNGPTGAKAMNGKSVLAAKIINLNLEEVASGD